MGLEEDEGTNPMVEDGAQLSRGLLGDEAKASAHPRRWVVVFLTACGSAMNAFMFMNFSPITELSASVFSVTGGQVNWLYSASLLSVLPAFFFAVDVTSRPRTQRSALVAMHALNLASASLRLVGTYLGSYVVALASSICLGVAASVVISAFTSVSQRWLPRRERAMGVAATVQSNYFGWLLGAVLVPFLCGAKVGLVRLLVVQCGAAAAVLAAAVAATPADADGDKGAASEAVVNADADAAAAAGGGDDALDIAPPAQQDLSLAAAVRELAARPRWVACCGAYALAGGVGFAVPAAQDIVFGGACAFSPKVTAVANAAFIASGVLAGLALGACDASVAAAGESAALLALMALGLLAVAGLAALVQLQAHCNEYACVGLMAAIGASTIGFVGTALGEAAKSAGPTPAARTYSGGCVEWWVQVAGAAITQIASNPHGFLVCAAVQAAAVLLAAAALLGLKRA